MSQVISGSLTNVPGFVVGHASDFKNITGLHRHPLPSRHPGQHRYPGLGGRHRQIGALFKLPYRR